jgi:hypothetical protein
MRWSGGGVEGCGGPDSGRSARAIGAESESGDSRGTIRSTGRLEECVAISAARVTAQPG